MHRENRGNGGGAYPCQDKNREFEILPKHRETTGNLAYSSCKFLVPGLVQVDAGRVGSWFWVIALTGR